MSQVAESQIYDISVSRSGRLINFRWIHRLRNGVAMSANRIHNANATESESTARPLWKQR